MEICRFLAVNGVVSHISNAPPVTTFLESHPGAYTTTRTHNNASTLLFWNRHLSRLADSIRILSLTQQNPNALSLSPVHSFINTSMANLLPIALDKRRDGEELAITALLSSSLGNLNENEGFCGNLGSQVLGVSVHIGFYVPPPFGDRDNGARLALVGKGRDLAAAKYSDWVRIRKPLERFRPPSVTELLLSNDGDRILEGCVTNFFVVRPKESDEVRIHESGSSQSFEVQTAPISDGVLPGVLRKLVIEVCSKIGIPLREVAPSWSEHETWEEAFITNSLRMVQHVEKIQVPSSWRLMQQSKSWEEIIWMEKHFEEGPGRITAIIQEFDGESMDLDPEASFIVLQHPQMIILWSILNPKHK
ncbi:Aminotransferase class IV, partial [Dillenia turbinata]